MAFAEQMTDEVAAKRSAPIPPYSNTVGDGFPVLLAECINAFPTQPRIDPVEDDAHIVPKPPSPREVAVASATDGGSSSHSPPHPNLPLEGKVAFAEQMTDEVVAERSAPQKIPRRGDSRIARKTPNTKKGPHGFLRGGRIAIYL